MPLSESKRLILLPCVLSDSSNISSVWTVTTVLTSVHVSHFELNKNVGACGHLDTTQAVGRPGFLWFYYVWSLSHKLLQLYGIQLLQRLPLRLQKCFVDSNPSWFALVIYKGTRSYWRTFWWFMNLSVSNNESQLEPKAMTACALNLNLGGSPRNVLGCMVMVTRPIVSVAEGCGTLFSDMAEVLLC